MKKVYFLLINLIVFVLNAKAQNWTAQSSGTTVKLNSVYAVSDALAFAVGADGKGMKTTNGGSVWTTMNTGTNLDLNSVQFVDEFLGYTYGEGQKVWLTNNGGTSWMEESGGTTTLNDGYYSGGQGWVVGELEAGYGFLYNPSTFDFPMPASTQDKTLNGVFFVSATTGWVVGDDGLVLKTTNFGDTWSAQTSGTTEELNDVAFNGTTLGIAVGNHGTILRTTNGTTWQTISAGTTVDLNDVYFADASNVWIAGNGGLILYSPDGGMVWYTEASGVATNLNGIRGYGTSVWAVGDGGTILHRSLSTGFEETNGLQVSVSPNPFTDRVSIHLNSSDTPMEMRVCDLNGRSLITSDGDQNALNLQLADQMSMLPAGAYFMKIEGKHLTPFTTILIKH